MHFSYLSAFCTSQRIMRAALERLARVSLAAMKANNSKKDTVTAPLLKDVVVRDRANQKLDRENVLIGSKPLNPPALYEDQGEGYNANFVFPQE